MKKLPNLNVLRFFLVAFVIIFHIPILSKSQGLPYFNGLAPFNRGVEAVYMFFVLLGYLFIRDLTKLDVEGVKLKMYVLDKGLRIIPLYYLITGFGFLFYLLLLPLLGVPFEIDYSISEGVILVVGFFANVFAFKYHPGGVLEILWAVALVVQFFALFMLFLAFIKKNRILALIVVLLVVSFLGYHFLEIPSITKYENVFFYFLIGVLVAILEQKEYLNFLKERKFYKVVIILGTLIFFFTNLIELLGELFKSVYSIVFFGLFIMILANQNYNILTKNRFLNYLGKISYGIYMYHMVTLNLVVFICLKLKALSIFSDGITIVLINIVTFAITIVLAHWSYKYFENPILKLKDRFKK